MPIKLPATQDSSLNMTPMIDIVFQLILFFLFNLKFKALDYRIESNLPKDRGIEATPQFVTPIPSIKISLFRLDAEDPTKARTKIKIAGGNEVILPNFQWTGNRTNDMKLEDDRDKRYAAIVQKIKELKGAAPELKGEIDTPRPSGEAVPHADVMRILDCFIQAGVTEVNFVGAPSPLPKAKGGHGT
jgi:biopolymer transport protein ExbD